MKKIILTALFIIASTTSSYAASCFGAKITYRVMKEEAYYETGVHRITINPNFIRKFSTPAKNFVINHECAHAKGIYNESKADDYAARVTKLTPRAIKELCDDFNSQGQQFRCAQLKKNLKI